MFKGSLYVFLRISLLLLLLILQVILHNYSLIKINIYPVESSYAEVIISCQFIFADLVCDYYNRSSVHMAVLRAVISN